MFPLLCPVRERDWLPRWDPVLVLSESGLAERGAVFITEVEGYEAIWVIAEHDSEVGRIAMVEIVTGLVAIELNIQVDSAGVSETDCIISYVYTALSPEGDSASQSTHSPRAGDGCVRDA